MDSTHPLVSRHGLSVSADGEKAFERFYEEEADAQLRLEGTTHTFYQSIARDQLAGMKPQPRLIMLLREPAARVLSSFRFTRDNLANCDRSLTFDQYVDWLLSGWSGNLDRFYRNKESLWVAKRELELGKYVRWIDWWLERMPPKRLRLILFEQMRTYPREAVMDLCGWLGVNENCYEHFDFNAKNATYPVGRQGLHRMIRQLGPLIPRSSIRAKAKAAYLRWQGRGAAPDKGYEEGVQRLRTHFAPYNRELSARYSLDLQRWWGEKALHADE